MTDSAFDRFVEPLNYPMFVLTVPGAQGASPSGCLVGFATQCSISPPRFLVCLSTANHTFRQSQGASVAALHLLTDADRDLAALFGGATGDRTDKFARLSWREGPGGAPILARCPTWIAGTIAARFDLGDHHGLLLDPLAVGEGLPGGERPAGADSAHCRPLMLSAVSRLHPGHPA